MSDPSQTPAPADAAALDDLVDIVVESPRWAEAGLDPDALAREGTGAAAAELGTKQDRIATIVFGGDALLQRLNARFRDKDAPTNVLAFPGPAPISGAPAPDPAPLGDVVLGFETIAAEAAAHGISVRARALHMIVHGWLHLHGYDHQTENDAHEMESMERKSLARLGLADPYEVDGDV
jgi:probable rRNA maturation factor